MKIFEYSKEMVRFYLKFMRSVEMDTSLGATIAAYALRAVAMGFLIPMTLKQVTDLLSKGAAAGEVFSSLTWNFAAITLMMSLTEWPLKLFWDGLAKSIVKIKKELLKEAQVKGVSKEDMVGRLASDVDFVAWTFGNVYTTVVPNLLTSVASVITLYDFNTLAGVVDTAFILPLMVLPEYYMRRASEAREFERRYYSASIHYIEKCIDGDGEGPRRVDEALANWTKGIKGVIKQDRIYWSSALAFNFGVPAMTAVLVVNPIGGKGVNAGDLVGIIYASLNVYGPLINCLYGFALLGQIMAAIRRINSIREIEGLQVH
jgi:ABC-type multidrug transport system fused ATPase/permease subunit